MSNKNLAFTIIELITTIVVISTIAVVTSGIIIFFMRNTIFLPNQMNVQQIADAAMDIMIEGDDAKGLRFANRITALSANSVQFKNADNQNIRLEWLDGVIKRSIDGGAEEPIPYYATGNITVSGEDNILFRFFDKDENATDTPALVRRIEIKMIAMSGTGSIDDWEGKVALASSVKLYRFNQPPVFTTRPAANPETISQAEQSIISFSIDDPDEDRVSWTATLKGSSGGTLSQTSGTANVPYNVSIIYTPKKFGSATITINLNDDNGGTAEDFTHVTVTK